MKWSVVKNKRVSVELNEWGDEHAPNQSPFIDVLPVTLVILTVTGFQDTAVGIISHDEVQNPCHGIGAVLRRRVVTQDLNPTQGDCRNRGKVHAARALGTTRRSKGNNGETVVGRRPCWLAYRCALRSTA